MTKLLLRNGRLVDPSSSLDKTLDLLIEEGRIARIGSGLEPAGAELFDAAGLVVAPGFIDMHVHLREPGNEEAETIDTGARAAARGGFTAVACMPNTKPVADAVSTIEFILQKAKTAPVGIFPIAAITRGQGGEELVAMRELRDAGAIAFSDDGKPVANALMMRRAMEQTRQLDVPLIDHCEDPDLFRGGAMNEGRPAKELGLPGIPSAAEEIMVSRNIILAHLTGSRAHLAHMSTAGSMKLIRAAKADGVKITCEVTPHHFTLTDEAVAASGTNAKMNPPLRGPADVQALLEAIADGTVDVIASDHAPHHHTKKEVAFTAAAFGIIGLETSVALGLDRLVNSGLISLNRFVELYSLNAARILGLRRGIQAGMEANLTLFDPVRDVTIDAAAFASKSRNTPFDGWKLKGTPMATICNGRIVWRHPSL